MDYYAWVWRLSYGFGGYYFGIVVFTFLEQVVNLLQTIAFKYYSVFVIEEKYGFNKMTLKLFMKDLIKMIVLGLIISSLFSILLAWIVDYFQENFFIYAWIATITLMFILMFIYPSYIAPLFNKFENLDEEVEKEKKIKEEAEKLCD